MLTPEQFCYWLQGFMEVQDPQSLTPQQTQIIKDHLGEVFTKVTPDRHEQEPAPKKSSRIFQQGFYRLANPWKCKGQPSELIYRSSAELRFFEFHDQEDAIKSWDPEIFTDMCKIMPINRVTGEPVLLPKDMNPDYYKKELERMYAEIKDKNKEAEKGDIYCASEQDTSIMPLCSVEETEPLKKKKRTLADISDFNKKPEKFDLGKHIEDALPKWRDRGHREGRRDSGSSLRVC